MVNVVSKECRHDGCSKQAPYGVAGSVKSEFFAGHARVGMVNVNKTCRHDGCTK